MVNNTFLGLAQINNISYQEGSHIRDANYTISATVFTSGNTTGLDYQDLLYSGINLSSSVFPIYLIDSFSEDFNSEISEDGSYSEQQRIQVRFISGAAIGTFQNPITMAQNFAYNLVTVSNPPIGFINGFYSGWRQKPGKRIYNESLNLITNEYSVTESFKTLRDISGSYSINYTNSLQVGEDGVSNVREQGKVQGLVPDQFGNYYAAALSGEQYEVNNNSFNRCNEVFNTYQGVNAYPLSSRRITYGQTLNKFLDTVQYEVSYSNNPKINNLFSWEYTQSAEREKTECTYRIVEEGSVQGYSTDCTPATKYSNAIFGFSGIKTGIYNRSYSFYTGFSSFANTIKLIEQSDARDKIRGIIKYSQIYTDNLIYSYSGVKRMTINISDDYSVPGKNLFNIPNIKQIAQPNSIMTLARRGIQIDMIGFRGTVLTGYLNIATSTINSNIPNGPTVIDPYISNIEYNYNPRANQFNITTDWIYYDSGISLTQFLL